MWLLIAFIAPMFYGIANISDSLLANKDFKNPITLAFYASFSALFFLPLLLFFYHLEIPHISFFPLLILLGIINVLFLFPYYKGLQSDDTSIAVSFFGLGRIFIPIWAFFLVGERLSFGEYVGIILIIIGSILLSLKGSLKNIKFSKAILYILLASFIISFEGVILKYLFDQGVSVGVGVAGETISSFLFMLLFLIHKNSRLNIINSFSIFKSKLSVFFVEEGATFIAFFAATYAISIAPVSLVRGVGTLTPFFLLLYAKVLGKKSPHLFNEAIGKGITLKKIILFSITALGVFLIAK